MRILCFNWRDVRNPAGGGAEVYLHEIFKRLVAAGHTVTIFTSAFAGSVPDETIDGVRIVRNGGKYSVYGKAKQFYALHNAEYDVVIDSINTKPFDTPGFVKDKPIVAIIYQLAREYWFYETSFPLNIIGRFILEDRWLKSYREIPTITISDSSINDLRNLGFKRVSLVSIGLSIRPVADLPVKELQPTIIFMGRLRKIKFPDHAIDIMEHVRKEIPSAQLWILGDGPLRNKLQSRSTEYVKFFGRVPEKQRNELLCKSHVLVMPSIREGWGMVVTEANACGTPAVGYDVPGVRDAIKHGTTGFIVKRGDKKGLARAIVRILKDTQLRERLASESLQYCQTFDWDNSSSQFMKIIYQAMTSHYKTVEKHG